MQPVKQGELDGKRALVTGGSRGIGRAIAEALKKAGAQVTILGRDAEALAIAAGAGVADGFVVADVADRVALRAGIDQVLQEGRIDILVNNAGTAKTGPFESQDAAIFQAMLAQHVLAPAQASQLVLPAMRAAGSGRILMIGSTASVIGYAQVSAYCAAKHGMLGLTRSLALELARTGITVNAICPGFTKTDLVLGGIQARAAKEGREPSMVLAQIEASKPLGRLIAPEEVAAAALWLAGPLAAGVTGQAIVIDGAESIG